MGQDDVRRERDQFRRVSANVGRHWPSAQRVSIRTLRPTVQPNCCQRLQERRDAGLTFRIVRGCGQEHADAPHPLGLLRARRKRPRGRRAAEKRDELAPFHYPMSPVLPAERIAYLSYGRSLLRCGISVRPMSQMGQNRKGSP